MKLLQAILKSASPNCKVNHYNLRQFSHSSHYTVQEVKIPIPSTDSYLAGKLWEGVKIPNQEKTFSPIICMHGFLDNAGSFDSLLPLLIDENMTFFAVDMPGHGLSSHTKELYYHSFFDGLSTIQRITKYFGWDKVTLLGHSLGSAISYIFASCFPETVDRYIALDNFRPLTRDDPTKLFKDTMSKLFEIEQKTVSGAVRPLYTFEEILERLYQTRNKTVTLEGCKLLLKRGSEKVTVNGEERYRFTHDIKNMIPSTFRCFTDIQTEIMGQMIKCPVCVIKGEPGGDYEPRENFMKLVELVSRSTERLEFHLVPGTHHFHLNEPHLVAPIISKFLDSECQSQQESKLLHHYRNI